MAKLTVPILVDVESIKDYLAQNDIEQIVRCKDCAFYEKLSENTDLKICSFWEAELGRQAICNFAPTDFCSYGERKDNE